MEVIGLILVITFVIFLFGLYADHGGSSILESNNKNNKPGMQYYTVSKKKS